MKIHGPGLNVFHLCSLNCSYLWINYILLLNNKCSILGCTVGYQASRCQNNALPGEKLPVSTALGKIRLQSKQNMDAQVTVLHIVITKEQDTAWFVEKG